MNIINKALIATFMLTVPTLGTLAEEKPASMYQHQQKMNHTMSQMDALLEQAKNSSHMQARHQVMQKHHQMMQEGVSQLKDMMAAKRQANASCLEQQTADNQTCYQVESHDDTRIAMMLKMIEHVMERQAMMEKAMHQGMMKH